MNISGNTLAGAAGGYAVFRSSKDSGSKITRGYTNKSTKKKQLNYNHREISAQILRATKTSSASGVLARARSKLSTLRRCQGTGQYNERELTNAIIHARRMVQCASKKVQNLKEEEMLQKKLEREHGTEKIQKKAEVKQRIARKERQLEQKIIVKELEQEQKEERERRELILKQKTHRNRERGKINEADMKYIKGKIESMKEQGYSADNSEIVQLQASLEEISREQMKLEAVQEAEASLGETAGTAEAAPSDGAVGGSQSGAASAVGSTVDVAL